MKNIIDKIKSKFIKLWHKDFECQYCDSPANWIKLGENIRFLCNQCKEDKKWNKDK